MNVSWKDFVEKVTVGLVAAVIVVVVVVGVSLLLSFPVKWLWNWLIPTITKDALTPITFWQAWGLMFLTSLLLRSGAGSSSKKG
jgi:ABC-type antimicrobial peptide transport system permease subunit